MAQADTEPSIQLTKKGERAVAEQGHARSLAVEEKRQIQTIAAAEVSRLIDLLDRLDDDPDLEPGGDDEPSLGFTPHGHLWFDAGDDRELDDVDDEDSGDAEPSLASLENRPNQEAWAIGARRDMEDEHDGREYDDEDREPEEEGGDHAPDPAYFAKLQARRGPRRRGADFVVGPDGVVNEVTGSIR